MRCRNFLVFSRERFKKVSISILFKALSIIDTMLLWQISIQTNTNLQYPSSFDAFACKILEYFDFWLPSASAWILAYASFTRYMSIRSVSRNTIFNNNRFNIAIVISVVISNCIIFSPVLIFQGMIPVDLNSTNMTYECWFITQESAYIANILFLMIGIVIPFICMFSISIALTYFVIFTKQKFINNMTQTEQRNFRKEQKLGACVIALDIMFFITQTPYNTFDVVVYDIYNYIAI